MCGCFRIQWEGFVLDKLHIWSASYLFGLVLSFGKDTLVLAVICKVIFPAAINQGMSCLANDAWWWPLAIHLPACYRHCYLLPWYYICRADLTSMPGFVASMMLALVGDAGNIISI